MNFRSLRPHAGFALFSAVQLALSVATAQQETRDPFLDAMLQETTGQTGATDSSSSSTTGLRVNSDETAAETPQQTQGQTKDPRQQQEEQTPQATPQTHLINRAQDARMVDDSTVLRELGEQTGLGIIGQQENYDGRRVAGVSIRYEKGKASVPDRRLLDVIQTSPGSVYSTQRINDDLERLLNKGLVGNNARVVATPVGDKAVQVTFVVEPSGLLGGAGFTGNRKFTARELREATKLVSGHTINDHDLAQARAEIIRMYQDAGYPDVKVNWRHAQTARSGYRDVIFDITEGREVRLRHINFTGNRQFDSQQLRQMMKTKQRDFLHWINDSGIVKREQLEDDLQEILRHYRNYGYLRAAITKTEYTDRGKLTGPQDIKMRVHIYEGPRYRVRRVSFKGNKVYTDKQLEPGLSMLNGDIYSLQKVSDDATMIRRYYGAKGYADADVRPDINEAGIEKDGTHLIDICYEITEGSPYAVGRIHVRGNTKTKQHVILRELPLKPGQFFNSVDLETARKRLTNLGYFDGVDVSPALSDVPGYRDININVHERMTGTLSLGVAVSSVESVYLYANATQSNFDIRGLFGKGSFVGGGQRLTVQGKLGFENQSAHISLVEPWFLDRKLSLGNEVYYSNSSYLSDYYTQENYGYAISLSRALNDQQQVRLEYRIENYNLDLQGMAPYFFILNCGEFTRSNLRLSWLYDTRDALVTPRKGGHFEVHASYSGPGSTVETYSTGIEASIYHNSIWDSIFSLHLGMETIDTVKKEESVPIFERCYLGGPGNLRGFRFRDVGMIDEAWSGDETMGGNSSAYVQAEVTIPVVETVRFAFFVDAGFVHEKSFSFQLKDFCADYGIGLRINLPGMGPMAVDYAIPFVTHNAVDRSGQFQFYVDYKY